jgi:hypothetical protein
MRTMKQLFILVAVIAIGIFSRSGGSGGDYGVDDYARQLQNKVGARVGLGRVTAIAAEGDILVVTFDGPTNWRQGMPSFQLTRPFLEGFCKSGRAEPYFHEGRTIRLDTTEEGRGLIRGQPSSRCPDA